MAWMALGELQDLVGELEQLLVLALLLLDHPPLVVGQDLAFLVGPILADHDKGRQKDRLQRHDHGQQPVGVMLDPQDQLGDSQRQLGPPVGQLGAGQGADQVHDPEDDQVPGDQDGDHVQGDGRPDEGEDPGGHAQDAGHDEQPAPALDASGHRQLGVPPNRKATPTRAATAARLPTR